MRSAPREYYARCLEHPSLILGAVSLVLLAAAFYWPRFAFDASSDTLVAANDPAYAYYLELGTRFPTDEFLLVTYTPENGKLFTQRHLAALDALQIELGALPSVASTYSILDAPLAQSASLREDSIDLQRAKSELIASPLFGAQLISSNGRSAAIRAVLGDGKALDGLKRGLERARDSGVDATDIEARYLLARESFRAGRAELMREVRAIRDRHEGAAAIVIGGVPMIAADMIDYVRSDVIVFTTAAALIIALMLFLFFRRLRWVALSVLNCAVAVGVMIGVLGMLRTPVTVVSANFISLLSIITIAFTIHLIVRYRELLGAAPDRDVQGLVLETMISKFAPCFYTALTTIVAFSSLLTSKIVPVADFGWMMSLGVALAFVVTYTLFPATLLALGHAPPSSTLGQPLRLAEGLAKIATRYPIWILAGTAVLTIITIFGIARLSLQSQFTDYFKSSSEIREGLAFIDANFGGTLPLDIVIQMPPYEPETIALDDDFFFEETENAEVAWFTNAKIDTIRSVEDYLAALPDIGAVSSLADLAAYARDLNQGTSLSDLELALAIGSLPDEQRRALLVPLASPTTGEVRIMARAHHGAAGGFALRIEHHLREAMGLDARVSGMAALLERSLQQLYDSQRSTLLYVLLATFAMFLVLLRSLPFALFGIATNAIAAALVLSYMGYAAIPLDMMTITIAAICIGIGVDDAIHYLHRFREERLAGASPTDAVIRCHRSIGRAIYFTSLTVIVGFSVLMLSNFVPTIYFGVLTALAMVLAMIANLLLLPSLLVVFERVGAP